MMRSFLFRIIWIGACVAALSGCDILVAVVSILRNHDPVAKIQALDVPETGRSGSYVTIGVRGEVQRGCHYKGLDSQINEASRTISITVNTESDPWVPPPEGATASPTPDPRPSASPFSASTDVKPGGVGLYRIEARVDRDPPTATRDLVVLPPRR